MKWVIIYLVFFVYLSSSRASKCLTRGRFPDNSQPNCRGYTMCLSGTASYDLLCPENSIYSHLDYQCTNVTTYQCYPDYKCTKEGNYVIPTGDCKSYIACVKDLNNVTIARTVACPANELFSEKENSCVNETLFVCKITTKDSKVFQVNIDQVKINPGNLSFHNGGCICTMNFIQLIIIYSFVTIFL